MATGATGQLGLALPVQGELSGTWGDTVNNGITQYTNIAIAGTLTLTGDGAVTLANTTGDASASNITSTLAGAGTVTAQFSAVRVSGTTTTKVVTGPSYSKTYLLDNASSYAVTFKASGQTGVSISPGEKVYVYYNATDYVKVGGGGITYGAVKTTTYTAVANDGVQTSTSGGAFTVNLPASPATGTQVFVVDSAGTWGTNNLTIGRNGSTIAGSATDLVCDINSVSIQCIYDGTTWDIFAQIGANDTAVVTLNGTQTLTNKTLTAPVLTAPVLGTPASGTVTNLTGTASININGTVGATTASTGAFTTLSASSTLSVTGAGSIQGLTVGRGAGAVSTNTVVGSGSLNGGSQTGTYNTVVGYQAATSNTTGNSFVAIGPSAFAANTTGSDGVAIGSGALAANTTGSTNHAVGRVALLSNTTGSNNSAFGGGALQNNTTASNNTAVGYQAGYSNTTGQNTFFGSAAGYTVTTGTNNVFLGRSAGNLTTSSFNTMVGDEAGRINSTGAYNTFVGGRDAGGVSVAYNNTTGSSNSAFGSGALASNTTASNNVAVGYQAGYTNTTGTSLVAMGRNAALSNTTGNDITAIGRDALYSNTTGASNTALGSGSLLNNTTASNNTAVGYQAGYSNTTASEHVAVGYQAAYSNTTGVRLVAVGYQALYTNTTGTNNVAVGKGALQLNTTGSSNIGIGYGTGVNVTTGFANTLVGNDWSGVWGACGELITTGSGNSFYGTGSGRAMTTGSKNTIIGSYSGNQGGLDIRTASNTVVLSDGDGNPVMQVESTGYTVIGYGTRGADGGVLLMGSATSGQGPCINGFTGAYGARTARWYAGSNSFVKGGTTYDTYTVMAGSTGGVNLTNGATSWTSASDERLKDIIEPITDAATKVSTLRAVIGKYKTDAEGTRRPFLIAQDVQAVLPEAVTEGRNSKEDETEYLQVAYTEVIPLLVAAIKELKAEIDTLKGNV